MAVKVGISGFGRISRVILRILLQRETDIDVVAINYRKADLKRMKYQLEYDSVFGRLYDQVDIDGDALVVGGKRIPVFTEDDPEKIDWASVGAEYIIEATGKYLTEEGAAKHFVGGAKKVILSAPGKDASTPTFVMGVNEKDYDPSMKIVSNASCTTNCLAPLTKVLLDNFGIERALMTTVHASTSKQKAVDAKDEKDWRIGRSVYGNIIPSSTGAAKAVGKVLPAVKGKMTGMSVRIPAADVSVVDLTAQLTKPTTYEEICAAMKKASENELKGILEYNTDEIVSQDIRGDFCTCVFDSKAGIMLDDTFVKLIAWYDNEWGYANQLVSMTEYMGHRDQEAGV
ncbi:MAG: type I glyceraldehyde-3-phosphate dehydrogenase [Lachnospiraceae bacterium]|nr:type I glyceraldehyde-3-phosphate dehydrogenase [Lachnospiraceae bacterium]